MPLLRLLVVTTAVRLPAVVGKVVKFTVNWVDVALATVPTAPLLKTTVLFPGMLLKFIPEIIKEVAFDAKLVVFEVTVGLGAT